MTRFARLMLGVVCAFLVSASTRVLAAADGHWVTAWQGSPTPGGTFYSPGCPSDVGLSNQTVRNVVYVTAGGNRVRIRLSNVGGANPLRIGAASVGMTAGGAAVNAGSLAPLQFGGQASLLIPAGGEALSDPVNMKVNAFDGLAVSIFLPDATGPATQHYIAEQTNYLASGDQSQAPQNTAFTHQISCWMFVSGVDVSAPGNVLGALVALGDSITDGYLSTASANRRFTDDLARRLIARHGLTLSVANAGISGNEILTIRPQLQFGYPTGARLPRDVLIQASARVVILLMGINDIGDRSAKAEDLIAADLQLIAQAHASGLKIFGGTLTPFGGSNAQYGGDYGTPAGEAQRQLLNDWIRTSGAFDGVIDFDKALRDPANPTQLLPAYDADHLHPNDAGYQAMADAVALDAIFDVLD